MMTAPSKRLLWLYGCALILALTLFFSLKNRITHTGAYRDYPEIAQAGSLEMAIEYSPQSYAVGEDSLVGFEYELARLIARRSGLEVNLHPIASLGESFNGLKEGRFDAIARLLPVTEESLSQFAFTEPVLLNRQVLVQRKASYNNDTPPIRNQLLLAGKQIHIPSEAPSQLQLRNLMHEMGDTLYIHWEPLFGEEQLIILVANGKIDYTVCSESMARRMSEHYPQIDIQTPISFTQFSAWALRKESPILKDSLDKWLKEIQDTPEFEHLKKAYLKGDPLP